jgi:death on curing protein
MNTSPRFLTIDEVIDIHHEEIIAAGGAKEMRDLSSLESALGAVQATYNGEYLMDIFEMASTYIVSIATNHPFVDGNKRTAAASALTFLYLNGYSIEEKYDEEIADLIVDLLIKIIKKDDVARYLRENAVEI